MKNNALGLMLVGFAATAPFAIKAAAVEKSDVPLTIGLVIENPFSSDVKAGQVHTHRRPETGCVVSYERNTCTISKMRQAGVKVVPTELGSHIR